MTQSVADKTPIPEQTWRRHTDPPGLWIVIITGSVTLHLLLFWLVRSFGLSLPHQHSSSAVPIEFIEIAPKTRVKARPQSKAKPVPPHPQTTIQKSVSANLPKRITQEKFTPKSALEDSNTIAFANNKQVSKSQSTKLKLPKKNFTTPAKLKFTTELTLPPKLVTIPSPDIPHNIKPTHIHRIHTPGNSHPQPKFSPSIAPEQSDQASTLPLHNTINSREFSSPPPEQQEIPPSLPPVNNGEAIGEAPKNQLGETPRTQKPQMPTKVATQPSPPGLVATWNIEANGVQKDRPENLAKPIGISREKDLNLPSLDGVLSNQPVEFQASLIIDREGKLLDIVIEPTIPEPKRTQYREYTQKVFQGQKFIPATSSNGDKPPLSNLVVKITIRPKSP